MSKPKLSVCLANYNHARFLPTSIPAILEQSWAPDEFLILDDTSTDDSWEVLQEFARDHSVIRLMRNEKNLGVALSIPRLMEVATGDYIMFCAADDVILPGHFEASMTLLTRHPQAGLCSTMSRIIDEDGRDEGVLPVAAVSRVPAYFPPEVARKHLMTVGNWMQGNTTIYRRSALLEARGFLPELRAFHDNFASQVVALRHGACFIPRGLAAWRRMPTTYSATLKNDPTIDREILQTAKWLMQTEFRDVFPPRYIRVWEQDWLFTSERIALSTLARHQEKFLAFLTTMEQRPGLLTRAVLGVIRLSFWWQRMFLLLSIILLHFPTLSLGRAFHGVLREEPEEATRFVEERSLVMSEAPAA